MTQTTARYWLCTEDGYHTEHTLSGDLETVLKELMILRMSGTIGGWETYRCDIETFEGFTANDWEKREHLRIGQWYDRDAIAHSKLIR